MGRVNPSPEDRGRRRYRHDQSQPKWRLNERRNIEHQFTCRRCGSVDWWPQITRHGREHPELCQDCWRDDFWGRKPHWADGTADRFIAAALDLFPGSYEVDRYGEPLPPER